MSFKKYIQETDIKSIIESIIVNENITIKDFIKSVNSYSSLDDALENLSDDYIEFYLKNMNNKALNKELKKRKLIEFYDLEQNDLNVGMSPKPETVKKIHYKGNYIVLSFDPVKGWVPGVSFRSISKATKFIKKIYDEFEQN